MTQSFRTVRRILALSPLRYSEVKDGVLTITVDASPVPAGQTVAALDAWADGVIISATEQLKANGFPLAMGHTSDEGDGNGTQYITVPVEETPPAVETP